MIVPERVQHAMRDEVAHLRGERVPLVARLAAGLIERDHDLVGEGEDVGRLVLAPELVVERAHGRVVDEGDRQLVDADGLRTRPTCA